jgi:hypothetical protein
MSGPNGLQSTAPSDSQSGSSTFHTFKKASKRVVLAMRFLNVNSHSENGLSGDGSSNKCPEMPVQLHASFHRHRFLTLLQYKIYLHALG